MPVETLPYILRLHSCLASKLPLFNDPYRMGLRQIYETLLILYSDFGQKFAYNNDNDPTSLIFIRA